MALPMSHRVAPIVIGPRSRVFFNEQSRAKVLTETRPTETIPRQAVHCFCYQTFQYPGTARKDHLVHGF